MRALILVLCAAVVAISTLADSSGLATAQRFPDPTPTTPPEWVCEANPPEWIVCPAPTPTPFCIPGRTC